MKNDEFKRSRVDRTLKALFCEAFGVSIKCDAVDPVSYVSATSECIPGPKFCPLMLQISPDLNVLSNPRVSNREIARGMLIFSTACKLGALKFAPFTAP